MKITLKAARVNAGMTQKHAAEQIGVSEQTLSNYERNISYPRASDLVRICKIYCINMDDIVWTV